MSETTNQNLSGVTETLLITTLYLRVMESQRSDALIQNKKIVALVKQISNAGLYDFSWIKSLHLSDANKLVILSDCAGS